MFTGIIQAKGRIKKIEKVGGDKRLLIDAAGLPLADLELGASIAINGVCLTAVEFIEQGFWADVSVETLTHTTLGDLLEGIVLHSFEGKSPFSDETLAVIAQLKSVYGCDLTAADSHKLEEDGA